ncbi:manganese catalase family protein [Marivirga sp. S37H4]|uniref:Manganese catalase family protein n=1 Tax=Marivirga aurantiaca TaxID=2802615 RepID=A0A934WWF1_9BACT|nr:manganese catalase family protein [Marivirga aurantiaca]MBK6264080.1 manganese catalase family protein [Marivirga aurantiaca]
MFYHAKELQFNARVSKPDPKFARLLLEQFGGGNGELKAAMQYFVQAFSCKNPYPDKYDMLMDIATEEFSHLEIVGATIQMLLNGVNGELKDTSEKEEIMSLLDGKSSRDGYIHEAMVNPQFTVLSGGGPTLTDSNGVPWTGAYVNANGDPSVDMRSNIGAESRAKIVYEYLMKFTDDPDVKETLKFLMTREVAHMQMFEAALSDIENDFPPGVRQADPRYSNTYFDMSSGFKHKGPWNTGKSSRLGEEWQHIEDPLDYVIKTNGLKDVEPTGTHIDEDAKKEREKNISEKKSKEIKSSVPDKDIQWSKYDSKVL